MGLLDLSVRLFVQARGEVHASRFPLIRTEDRSILTEGVIELMASVTIDLIYKLMLAIQGPFTLYVAYCVRTR